MNSEKSLMSNPIIILIKKEFIYHCKTPVSYGAALFFVLLSGILFIGNNTWLYSGQSDFKIFFLNMPVLFCVMIPLLTMNSWADEKKQFTDKLLFSLPISIRGIVLGKYLSLIALWFLILSLTMIIPISVFSLGYFSIPSFFLSWISVFLFGTGIIAISLAIAAVSRHSAVNFLISFLIISFFTFIHLLMQQFENYSFITAVLNYFSFIRHFESAARGVFDSRDFIFYFILVAFGIELNTFILQIEKDKR